MSGLELSKLYYEKCGLKAFDVFGENILSRLAFGMFGKGSECFGFDDYVSTDHDFEPGFIVVVPDDFDEKITFQLTRAYAKMPREFMGYKREVMSAVGGSRHGIKKMADVIYEFTGTLECNLSTKDWLLIPEESLAEFTNGKIFRDDSKILTKYRLKLSTFPHDIFLKKLAGTVLLMAQSGQYNYKRCIMHKELNAARLSAYEFVKHTIHATCLFNEVYMPYYKWQFRVLKNLSWPNKYNLDEKLSLLLKIDDNKLIDMEEVIDEICKVFVERIMKDNLTNKTCDYLESHAYEINNKIHDINLRNMNILAGIN